MRRSVLLIAPAFAAGLLLGYAVKPAPPADRAAREAATVTAGAEPGETPLRERLMALPAPDLPTGDGTIRGQVRDDDGEPLGDVLVVASLVTDDPPRKSRKGAAAPQDREIDDMVADLVRAERAKRESRRSARTAADGSYELTGIADAKWTLRAYKEGHEFQPHRSSAYNVGPGATVDFVGGPIVRIDVDVLMPDGTRPRMAQIHAAFQSASGSSTRFDQWFPDDRWIELKPHVYELTALVQGEEYLKSQPQTVKVDAGAALSLVFRLGTRPALSVHVAPSDGMRLQQWSVWAMRFAGDKPPDKDRLRAEGMQTSGHGPRERGAAWQDLAPGSYVVGAGYSTNSPILTTEVVQVGAGTTEVELRLPAPDPKSTLVVRVADPDGAAPRDVRFHLGSSPRSMGTATVLERTDGAYVLVRDGRTEPETWVAADSKALGRIVRACAPEEAREILLTFERPGYANLDIVGYAKSPHAGWLGFALVPRGERLDFSRERAKPSSDGACRLGPAQPGPFDLVVYSLVNVNTAWTAATIPVDLRSGEQTVTINIPPLHAVTVRWPGEGKGRSVTLHSKEPFTSWIRREVTEAVTTIERVPAGRYELRPFGAADGTPIEFEVPAQTEITIR